MKKDYMCVLSNKQIVKKIQKIEKIDEISKDLFFSTDCKILLEKNSRRSAILVCTRNNL